MRLYLIVLLTAALALSTPAHAALTLDIEPGNASASTIDIALRITGLGEASAPSLGAFDLDLRFDAGHLSYLSAVLGDPVLGDQLDLFDSGTNPYAAALTGPGVLNVFELSLDPAGDLNAVQAGSFTLAVVTFDVVRGGSSQMEFAVHALSDAEGNALSATWRSVSVTTVPVPAAAWGLGSAFAALLGFRRRVTSVNEKFSIAPQNQGIYRGN